MGNRIDDIKKAHQRYVAKKKWFRSLSEKAAETKDRADNDRVPWEQWEIDKVIAPNRPNDEQLALELGRSMNAIFHMRRRCRLPHRYDGKKSRY